MENEPSPAFRPLPDVLRGEQSSDYKLGARRQREADANVVEKIRAQYAAYGDADNGPVVVKVCDTILRQFKSGVERGSKLPGGVGRKPKKKRSTLKA